MSDYVAPLKDMQFVLRELAGLDEVAALPGYEEATPDLVDAVLEEAGKFANGVLSPINFTGDQVGAKFNAGNVTTAPGWNDAYKQFCESGWSALAGEPDFGGQGLPHIVSTAVIEMWKGANMAFALCPMLTNGAIEAIKLCGNDAQKALYLPKMVSGEWTGTMNLTEANAGSDLAAVRARAEPNDDGTYRIYGQKVFITYGDHDLTDNIVHLVLARLPDAPEGVKGISLFVVPKFLVNADGSLGARNDVDCVSIEHKLGIHGSPTREIFFENCWIPADRIVGEPGTGFQTAMRTLDHTRVTIGAQALGIAQGALDASIAYAKDRKQFGKSIATFQGVQFLIADMAMKVESARALTYAAAARSERGAGDLTFFGAAAKCYASDVAMQVTTDAVQVFGGAGYVRDNPVERYMRDAKITQIYEGTNQIQRMVMARQLLR